MARRCRIALVILGVAALCSCGRRGLDSVLLITVDTLRADHVSCYGRSPVPTPALDALAARGARATRAWTPIPLTTPAHASILTGLYPPAHGLRNNGRFRLPDDVTTLAEVLQPAGTKTGAFVASVTTLGLYGLDQGFDLYDDDLGNDAQGQRRLQRPANEVVDRALAWLGLHAARPFLLWVHLYDPHAPYEPPAEYRRRFPEDPYSGEVAFADAEIGRLLRGLEQSGAAPRTVVVALADHGEGLKTHGEDRHGLLLYEESLHIPLILAAPGRIAEGTVLDATASAVDVMPTILALLGRGVPAAVQGRSLLALPADRQRLVYAETLYPREEFGWSALYALRQGDLKYVAGPVPELFDLGEDPGERRDLSAARPQEVQRMAAALSAEAGRLVKPERLAAAAGLAGRDDPEVAERLASLGYLGGGLPAAEALPAVGGRSPRDALGDYETLLRARTLQQDGRCGAARELLARLAQTDAGNPQVWLTLARSYECDGRQADADKAFRELLRRAPSFYLGYRYFSDFLVRQGRFQAARQLWLDLGDRMPGYVEIQVQAARVEVAGGLMSEAVQRLVPYLETHDHDGEAWSLLGRALMAVERKDEALRAFEFALDLRPTDADAVAGALRLLAETGRRPEARALLERLQARAPHDPMLRQALEQLR